MKFKNYLYSIVLFIFLINSEIFSRDKDSFIDWKEHEIKEYYYHLRDVLYQIKENPNVSTIYLKDKIPRGQIKYLKCFDTSNTKESKSGFDFIYTNPIRNKPEKIKLWKMQRDICKKEFPEYFQLVQIKEFLQKRENNYSECLQLNQLVRQEKKEIMIQENLKRISEERKNILVSFRRTIPADFEKEIVPNGLNESIRKKAKTEFQLYLFNSTNILRETENNYNDYLPLPSINPIYSTDNEFSYYKILSSPNAEIAELNISNSSLWIHETISNKILNLLWERFRNCSDDGRTQDASIQKYFSRLKEIKESTKTLISFDYISIESKKKLQKIEECFSGWDDSHKEQLDLDYYIQFYYDYAIPFPVPSAELLKKDVTLEPFISEIKYRMYDSFLFKNRLENILQNCERVKKLSNEEISWEKFLPPNKWREDFKKQELEN